jgi:hypothetical protein
MARFDDAWEEAARADEMERELVQYQRGADAFERQVERDQQAYADRIAEALRQRDAVQEALMDLIDVVESTPFHAYSDSRAQGHPAHLAVKVNEWMGVRDRVLNAARRLVF